jgi:hypothetical protein
MRINRGEDGALQQGGSVGKGAADIVQSGVPPATAYF